MGGAIRIQAAAIKCLFMAGQPRVDGPDALRAQQAKSTKTVSGGNARPVFALVLRAWAAWVAVSGSRPGVMTQDESFVTWPSPSAVNSRRFIISHGRRLAAMRFTIIRIQSGSSRELSWAKVATAPSGVTKVKFKAAKSGGWERTSWSKASAPISFLSALALTLGARGTPTLVELGGSLESSRSSGGVLWS